MGLKPGSSRSFSAPRPLWLGSWDPSPAAHARVALSRSLLPAAGGHEAPSSRLHPPLLPQRLGLQNTCPLTHLCRYGFLPPFRMSPESSGRPVHACAMSALPLTAPRPLPSDSGRGLGSGESCAPSLLLVSWRPESLAGVSLPGRAGTPADDQGLFLQGSLDTQALSLGPGLARRSVLKRPVIEMPTDVLSDEAETACLALRGEPVGTRLCPSS